MLRRTAPKDAEDQGPEARAFGGDDELSDEDLIAAAETPPATPPSSESEAHSESEGEEEDRPRPATRADAVLRAANTPVTVREVPAGHRATSDALTCFEAAAILAARAAQIERGGAVFIDIPEGGALTAERIALLELQQRRTPLLVSRVVGVSENGDRVVELVNPRTAALPPLPDL